LPSHLPNDVINFVKLWNSTAGQYVDGSEISNGQQTRHEILDMEAYIHITSPIRRLVDLLNQIILFDQDRMVMRVSDGANDFLHKWLGELDYLNTSMRSIRKVQTDCALLDKCFRNPEIMEKEYTGVMFDKMIRDNFIMSYMVYLKELKMLCRVNVISDIDNFASRKFKLYLFQNEEKTRKKIRLQLME
jgi:exoribonuclease R